MRRLASLRAVSLPHVDVDDNWSPNTPSYPSSHAYNSRFFLPQNVSCEFSNDAKYARQESIQFMVSRECIIRGAAGGQQNFHSAYTIGSELGTGAFGRVWSVRHNASGQIRAAKEIKKKDLGEEKLNIFEAEVAFLTKLDHPNVVRLIEFFKADGKDDSSMYLILELCQGPDLFDHIADVCGNNSTFSEDRASILFRSMLKAVLCCHCNNIVHRDIKPENFMFPTKNLNDSLKMIDLGLSDKFSEGNSLVGVIGTVGYMAPEVVQGKYSRECDIWSLGVILFMMLTGRSLLPMDASPKEVDRLVASGTYVQFQLRRYCKHISEDARSLLSGMLINDPSKRITAQEALRHPFIQRYYDTEDCDKLSHTVSTADFTKIAHMLEHYAQQSMLKRAALLLLAHIADEQDAGVRRSQHAFRLFDADGNGELTTEEINDALKSKGVPLPPNWPDIIRRVDVDAGGTVNFVEWTAATLPENVYSQERYLRSVFQFLDVRKVGEVTSADIVALFPSLKDASIESQQKVILSAIGKPSFNFDDFKAMMLANPIAT